MQFLSVAPLHETGSKTKKSSESESEHTHVCIDIEVVWLASSHTKEVIKGDSSTNDAGEAGLEATENLVHVLGVPESHMEQLWIVLDEFNWSNLLRKSGVFLLQVIWISFDVWSVSSHFYF